MSHTELKVSCRTKQIPDRKRCVMGISMSNPNTNGESFTKCLEWAKSNFEFVHILVADTLNRHNLILEIGDMDQAETLAHEQGEIWEKKHIGYNLPTDPGCLVTHWNSYRLTEEFNQQLEIVRQYYEDNHDFKEAIKQDIKSFQRRQKLKAGKQESTTPGMPPPITDKFLNAAQAPSKNDVFDRARDYLLEEIAVDSIFQKKHAMPLIYPGQQLQSYKLLRSQACTMENNYLQGSQYIRLFPYIRKIDSEADTTLLRNIQSPR